MKIFIAFDQMKDEPIRANALFNILLVFQLVIVYVIWRKAETVTASVNGMFDLQSLVWEEILSASIALYHPTLVGSTVKPLLGCTAS